VPLGELRRTGRRIATSGAARDTGGISGRGLRVERRRGFGTGFGLACGGGEQDGEGRWCGAREGEPSALGLGETAGEG
jgi:hypothetical protein